MSTLAHITVLGSGVLGGQIAWHSAFKGKTVVVYDIDDAALQRCRQAHDSYAAIYVGVLQAGDAELAATRARLRYVTDLAQAVGQADLVIEAVPEVPEIKRQVYRDMAPLLPPHTLIATNSSTLLPRDFAEVTGRPAQYCALHYANMIWTMNIVEIMAHPQTAPDTLREVTEFAIETGMLPVAVQKEQNGYLLNTWFVALLNAAQSLVTNGVGTPEDVDRTFLKVNPGATMGPMGMIDMVGMQTVFNVLSHWGKVRDDVQMLRNADYIKTQLLDRNRGGFPVGHGYYRYPEPAYAQPGFLDVPDLSAVGDIVRRATLSPDAAR